MPNPYRKSFDAVRLFPFFIVYKDRKSPQRELPNHLHDWVEIVYVYEGKGNFFIDSNFYEMEQGDFFAIPANTIHRAFPDKDNPVRSTAIFFDPILLQTNSFHEQFSHTQLFEWCRNRRYYKLPLFPDHQKTIDDYIQTIYTEETLQEKGYHHSIIMNLKMLLLFITRKYVHFNEQPVARPETGLV